MRVNARRNIRVVLEPRVMERGRFWGRPLEQNQHEVQDVKLEDDLITESQRIIDDIRRHVDDAAPYLAWDRTPVCSFCGYEFDASETADRIPFCCDEAQVEYITEHPDYTGEGDDMTERVLEVRSHLANPESN